MLSENRMKRRTLAVPGRALCVCAAVGLGCGLIPATVSASPVVVASPTTPTIVGLGQGATGAEVRAVQQALISAGVPVPGGADGVYGPATKSAVTAFQSRKGLAATGTIDAATASALGLATAAPTAPAATPSPTPAALAAATPAPGAPVVGATGPAVVALQQALMAAGVWLPRGADGVFGTATTRGISNFQSWNRLTVSGVVDAPTFARLKLGAPAASPTPPAPAAPAPAAPASSSSFSGMRAGARGDNVRVLQRALIAAGITVRGGADGVFGAMTTAALTTFQQSKGLAASGVVDDATIAALALSPGAPAPAPAPPRRLPRSQRARTSD